MVKQKDRHNVAWYACFSIVRGYNFCFEKIIISGCLNPQTPFCVRHGRTHFYIMGLDRGYV